MNNKGRKSLAMIIIVVIFGASIGITKNRIYMRMEADKPKTSVQTTVNTKSGKTSNSEGTTKSTTADDKKGLSIASTALHCRAGALKLNRIYDSSSEAQGTSTVAVGDMKQGATASIACSAVTPALISATGQTVNAGSINILCSDGQVVVTSSSCSAPPPPPPPVVAEEPPAPAPSPAPTTPTVDPAWAQTGCGTDCTTNAVSVCTRRQGKDNGSVTYNVHQCKNGQFLWKVKGKADACYAKNMCN